MNEQHLRDNRYEGIIHLVTAADGAEEFYLIDDPTTNEARYESVEEAVEKDKKIRMAYYTHPKWFLIDNTSSKTFKQKINQAKEAVHDILSLPVGANFFKKFILKQQVNKDMGVKSKVPIDFSNIPEYEVHEIFEDFINYQSKREVVKHSSVQKKGKNDSYTYTHEIVIEKNGKLLNKKRNISAYEYFDLLALKCQDRVTIQKTRVCGAIGDIYFIVDYFDTIDGQPILLILQVNEEVTEKGDRINIPEVFKIHREVTDQIEYSNYFMSQEDYKMIPSDKEATALSS
jgi:hypothetical protein